MNTNFGAGMADATQMTRAGRLDEATALIQRLLGGDPSPAQAPAPAEAPAQPALAREADEAPAAPPDAGRGKAGPPSSPPRPRLRETLRRLGERARALDAEEIPPPSVAPGARFTSATYRDAVGARDYKLYVPASARSATGPLPLVIMLHGCTQNPDDFALGTRMNAAAEEAGCLVAYPAQPPAANVQRCWNWFRPEDQRREAGEPALIAGIARAVLAGEDVDPARIFVAGLSAGGAAAAIMGQEYPELFAAVGVHSGLPHGAAQDLPSALAAMRQGARGSRSARPLRMIVFHGDADRTVHPANATALAAQATAGAGGLGLRLERGVAGGRDYSRALHSDMTGRTRCEHWTIHGAGHAWSGGDAAGSHVDPQGPDASREMLRFFLER